MNEKQSSNPGDVSDIIRGINQYYQEITVTDVTGHCPYGHRKGEIFRVTGMNHDCLCGAFYQAIHGPIQIQEYRGSLPWEQQPDMFHTVCPEMGKVHIASRRRENDDPTTCLRTRTDINDMTGKGFPVLDKYKIFLEVMSIEHTCTWGHKIGERCEVDPFNAGKACGSLYRAAYPFITMLLYGCLPPWVSRDEPVIIGVCPDPYDLLTYRLVREERQ